MVEYDYEQINKQELIWEDNNMSRLGMLYALNEEDVKKLRSVPEEERYEYMLEEIEEALIGSPRSCELFRLSGSDECNMPDGYPDCAGT